VATVVAVMQAVLDALALWGTLQHLDAYSAHADTLHNFYCTNEHSKRQGLAQRKRTSVLDQLVSQLGKDLEEQTAGRPDAASVDDAALDAAMDDLVSQVQRLVGAGGVIVVGGGYLGQKAKRGSKQTPVVQKILKRLSKFFRVVVVDEYLTSKMCHGCQTRMEQSSSRGFFCKTTTCNREVNRDENGARNILRVFWAHAYDEPRPQYLARPKKGASASAATPCSGTLPPAPPTQASPGPEVGGAPTGSARSGSV